MTTNPPETRHLSFWDPSLLPNRPYCTDDLTHGLKIRGRDTALDYPLIQVNNPTAHWALLLDMDRDQEELAEPWSKPGPAWAWEEAGLPAPTWIAVSRKTASCHYGYRLRVPVALADCARPQPLKYLAALERSYVWKLEPHGADPNYVGLITKNPEHQAWKVWGTGAAYTLGELADYLPRLIPETERSKGLGLGRNVSLFDDLRFWAYSAVRQYRDADRADWLGAVRRHAAKFNAFDVPLSPQEVGHVARSVGTWVWRQDPGALRGFVARQSWKGAGGRNPEQASKRKSENAKPGPGRPTLGEPWKMMGISRRTYFRRKKAGTLPRTDINRIPGLDGKWH